MEEKEYILEAHVWRDMGTYMIEAHVWRDMGT